MYLGLIVPAYGYGMHHGDSANLFFFLLISFNVNQHTSHLPSFRVWVMEVFEHSCYPFPHGPVPSHSPWVLQHCRTHLNIDLSSP